MRLKPSGISLLDVIVAVAIGSVIATLIYSSLDQTNRVVRIIDSLIDINTQLAFFGNRIERDISGAFIPLKFSNISYTDNASENLNPQTGQQKQTKNLDNQNQAINIFLMENMSLDSTNTQKNGKLSFVTSNPLIVYGESTPRIARVMYSLKYSEKNKSWSFMRYESSELDYKKFQEDQKINSKKIAGYEILRNIIKLETIAIALDDPKKESTSQENITQAKDTNQPVKIKRYKNWPAVERFKQQKSVLPNFLNIKGACTDVRKKREIDFDFLIPIAASGFIKKQNQDLNKISDKINQATSAPTTQNTQSKTILDKTLKNIMGTS